MDATAAKIIPIHQWTYTGDKVLLVKCVDRGGKSHNGFQWPKSGTVTTPNFAPDNECETGGLFGWAWGLNIGGGKEPNYSGDWIVFAAPPESVFDIGGEKAKAGPSAEVVYYGTWFGALELTREGRAAWFDQYLAAKISRAATEHATGWSGAASATGGRGAASATGWSGAASATGESGAASATGGRGAASATGWRGAASATGGRGIAAITGNNANIEVGPDDIGAVTSDSFTWIVHLGAIVLHRWRTGHALLTTDGLSEGQVVKVACGEIQK